MEGLRPCYKLNQLLLTLSFKILCFIFPLFFFFVCLFSPLDPSLDPDFGYGSGSLVLLVGLDPYSNYRENEEKEVKRIISAKDLF
jgi:hypothetical protein